MNFSMDTKFSKKFMKCEHLWVHQINELLKKAGKYDMEYTEGFSNFIIQKIRTIVFQD